MQYFKDIKIGQLFTIERKLKNNPHEPTLYRKKSKHTAFHEHNKSAWLYFNTTCQTFPKG